MRTCLYQSKVIYSLNVFITNVKTDTFKTRFALRFCAQTETKHFTTFNCHNEPTYVLTRKCTADGYGASGPCCKVDELFTYLMVDREDLFNHTRFVMHCDDDEYWRVDQLLRWLAHIENSGINTHPIIANGNYNDPKENIWHIKGCKEVHTNGWYQPMVLNHAAMERMKVAAMSYGFTETCKNFDITHDVGMGPFAWMFGFYHYHITGMIVNNWNNGAHLDPHLMVIHAVKHGRLYDRCDNLTNWGTEGARYKQNLAIGCGDLNEPMPHHSFDGHGYKGNQLIADMYDCWNFYKDHGQPISIDYHSKVRVAMYPDGTMLPGISLPGDEHKPKIFKVLTDQDFLDSGGLFQGYHVEERNVPELLKLKGYDETEHSKKFDIVKEWHPFTMTDCVIKGEVGFE